jgi:ribosome hibernation promoting factor
MKISITFRHMDANEAMKELVREKVSKAKKFIHGPMEANVVLSVERYLYSCDVTIISGGKTYKGSGSTDDMYASIDRVMDKIERQIDKSKKKPRASRGSTPL